MRAATRRKARRNSDWRRSSSRRHARGIFRQERDRRSRRERDFPMPASRDCRIPTKYVRSFVSSRRLKLRARNPITFDACRHLGSLEERRAVRAIAIAICALVGPSEGLRSRFFPSPRSLKLKALGTDPPLNPYLISAIPERDNDDDQFVRVRGRKVIPPWRGEAAKAGVEGGVCVGGYGIYRYH